MTIDTQNRHAVYHQGATLPDLALTLLDDPGELIPFATGYTFTATVYLHGSTTPAFGPKTTGIAGADTDPNVVISWADSGEIGGLNPGEYDLRLVATRTLDGRDRIFVVHFRVRA